MGSHERKQLLSHLVVIFSPPLSSFECLVAFGAMVEGFTELVQASGISVPARAKFVGRFVGPSACRP